METITQNKLKERIDEMNSMILQGQIMDAFEKFYAEEVTMQENEEEPTVGKAACRLHEESFVNNITEFRSAEVKHVIVSDNVTAVEWDFDFTHAEWGVRNYTQIAVQRWNEDGKIINEKFYYNH